MKKIILCFVLSIMTLLYSCNKDIEVDKGYQVNVTVDPSGVINSFIPEVNDDFDMSEEQELRINLFVYNEEGKLVEKLRGKCRDYSHKMEFSVMLPKGEYTFVATSDIYDKDIDFENWTFSNIDDINEFQIEQNWRFGLDGVLGVKLINDKILEPKNIQINLTSATALILCKIMYIHDDNELYEGLLHFDRYCVSITSKFNDKVRIEYNEFRWLPAPNGYYYHLGSVNVNPNYIGYRDYVSVLPITTDICVACDVTDLESGEQIFIEYPFIESKSATFKSGEQYYISVDLRECLFDITKDYNKNRIESMECADVDNKYESVKLFDLINNNPTLKLNNLSK